MPVHLLDVNVLVALAWANHVHHQKANEWFEQKSVEGWATCPITEAGFLRITSNPKAMQTSIGLQVALVALKQWTAHPNHVFWPDDLALCDAIADLPLRGHKQITDAYLAMLANKHQGQLATLDRGAAALGVAVTVI